MHKARRRLGLILYLQGHGVTSIGKQLGVSHVTVIKWVTKYGKAFEEIRSKPEVTDNTPEAAPAGPDG
jgi:transposase-like protein